MRKGSSSFLLPLPLLFSALRRPSPVLLSTARAPRRGLVLLQAKGLAAQLHGLDERQVRFPPGTDDGGEDDPEQDVEKAGKPALRGQQKQRDGEGGPGDEPDPEGRGLMRHGRLGQARQQSAVGYDEEEVAPALEARVACKLGPYGEAHCRLLGCVASWPAAFGGRGGGEALRQPVRLALRFVFGLRRLRKDDSRIRGYSGHEAPEHRGNQAEI